MFGRKKYEDDYYAEEDENGLGGTFIPPKKLDWLDGVIAALLGAFAAVFIWAFSYKGLHPTAWADCAVASGLRPAATLIPGLWRLLAQGVYGMLGVSGGNVALAVLGKVFVGVMVACTYLLGREILSILVRMHDDNGVWWGRLARWISALAALLLLCADPVWRLGQAFTPTTLLAFEFVLSAYLLARFLGSGTVRPVYYAMFVIGLFGAESPLGIAMLVGFWSIFYLLLNKGQLFHVQLLEPLRQQSSKWLITLLWALGLLTGVTLNVVGFISLGGLAETGASAGELPLKYAVEMWQILAGSASAGGWIVGLGFTLLPFVLAVALLRRATDLEYFLSYHVGIVFFFVGCLAYSQVASLDPLWFWTWSKTIVVHSGLLLFVGALMCVLAILCMLAVASVDAYCRDHRRLAEQVDPDALQQTRTGSAIRRGRVVRDVVFFSVLLLLAAGAMVGRYQPKTQKMLRLIDDFVAETIAESGDARWLFTDGNFDCGIELASACSGREKPLVCIPLMGGRQARSLSTLQRDMPDEEDRLCAEIGGGNILRTWQKDKPDKIAESAMSLGLEVWRGRGGRDYPPLSGVVAREPWKDAASLEAGRRNGYGLIERVLALYGEGGPDVRAGQYVNDMFLILQWRLARLARIRSEVFDRGGDVTRANEELSFAEALDDRNESLKRILEGMTRLRENTMRQMTPREGLQFALVRADFSLARRYAEPILDADPNDVDANFGMGMSYLMEEQYGRAEEYLKRARDRKPKEPAIWNNLAVIQFRQGRFAEAKENALKALSLLPESAEVKDTLKKIEAALSREAAPAAAPADPKPADKKD